MVDLVVFINLFFIPVLPIYIFYRKKRKQLVFSADLLFQYCLTTVCNIPMAKVFIFLIRKVSGIYISIDSGYYTLTALLSALLLPSIYLGYKKFEEIPDKKQYMEEFFKQFKSRIMQRGVRGILGELSTGFLLMFATCFMVFLYEPILMYSTNIDDFWFDFKIIIWPILSTFCCFLLIGILSTTIIYFTNLFFSKEIVFYNGLTLAGFIVFFLLYLQGNWLDGNLPPLTGAPITWEDYGSLENTLLIIALVLLCIAAVVCIRKFKLKRTTYYAAVGASGISFILLISLILPVVGNDAFESKDTFNSTLENFNTASSEQNFLIFLVDSIDSKTFYDVMMQDEDFCGILDDFSYYPDTLSTYPLTKNSIPNILTGAINRNETSFLEYSSQAYNQSPLFKKLQQNGYEINLYSPQIIWSGNRHFEIENSTSIYEIEVNFANFMEQELKYIQFKYLPYGLKQYSEIETLDFNNCRVLESNQMVYNWTNPVVYSYIRENITLNKSSENYFQFVHCEGGHVPCDVDKYMNSITDGTYEQKVAATLTLIKSYLQRLKDNDVYDNSTIIIMADHGYQIGDTGEHLFLSPVRCNPILFIKGAYEKHELLVSDKPVSYLDLQDAFCDLIDGKQSTELFAELQPGRTRTVIWYDWVAEQHMVEYETTGSVQDEEAFVPTGNIYDLQS